MGTGLTSERFTSAGNSVVVCVYESLTISFQGCKRKKGPGSFQFHEQTTLQPGTPPPTGPGAGRARE